MFKSNLRKELEQAAPALLEVRIPFFVVQTIGSLLTLVSAATNTRAYLFFNFTFFSLLLVGLVILWERKVSVFSPVNPWIAVALAIASFLWEIMGLVAL